jgi:hypothetical protein
MTSASTRSSTSSSKAKAAQLYLQNLSGWPDGRAVLRSDAVRIEFDDNQFEFGPIWYVDVLTPTYIELPTTFRPRYVQLASAAARDYLAGRVELGARDIAVAIIDDKRRFFFVVGSAVAPSAA